MLSSIILSYYSHVSDITAAANACPLLYACSPVRVWHLYLSLPKDISLRLNISKDSWPKNGKSVGLWKPDRKSCWLVIPGNFTLYLSDGSLLCYLKKVHNHYKKVLILGIYSFRVALFISGCCGPQKQPGAHEPQGWFVWVVGNLLFIVEYKLYNNNY